MECYELSLSRHATKSECLKSSYDKRLKLHHHKARYFEVWTLDRMIVVEHYAPLRLNVGC